MKIKQVEELVGITRKNIRFYEEQGLLSVERAENGYREYSLKDVKRLQEIRFLRKLFIPIEVMQEVFEGKKSLTSCMEYQVEKWSGRKRNMTQVQEFCETFFGKTDLGGAGCRGVSGTDGTAGKGGDEFYEYSEDRRS